MILFLLIYFVAVIQGSTVETVLDDLGSYAELAADIANAVSECEFRCPSGLHRYPNKYHKATANGCGSYGIEVHIRVLPELTECCNRHDQCYDTCGSVKTACDQEFKKCVQKLCSIADGQLSKAQSAKFHQACESATKVIYSSTAVFGCPAFYEAQKNACLCLS